MRRSSSLPLPAEPGLPRTARGDWHAIATLIPYLWEYRGRVLAALTCLIAAKVANVDSLTPAPRKAFEHHRAEMFLGVVLARAGLRDSARHVLEQARADRGVDPAQEILSIEAFGRTVLGDRDDAIALLKRYVAANPTHAFKRGGDISWWWRDLKSDPRFAQLTEAKP